MECTESDKHFQVEGQNIVAFSLLVTNFGSQKGIFTHRTIAPLSPTTTKMAKPLETGLAIPNALVQKGASNIAMLVRLLLLLL